MSKLSQLQEKSEKVIVGGVELDLYPFTLDDLDQIGGVDPNKPDPAVMKQMIKLVLKRAVPDATEEELGNFSIKYLPELSGHIERLNNLQVNTADDKLKNKIKRLQSESKATA